MCECDEETVLLVDIKRVFPGLEQIVVSWWRGPDPLRFFGVAGFQLRADLFFVVLGSFCVVGLSGISLVYLSAFW